MSRRRSATRNIILFAAAVVIMVGLIVLVGRTRHTVIIMPPEPPEMVAKRQLPDNAYGILVEAAQAIPAPLDSRSTEDGRPLPGAKNERRPGMRTSQDISGLRDSTFAARPRTVSGWFGFERDDNDAELAEYLRQCAPVVERVKEALTKPYSLPPVDWAGYSELPSNLYQQPPVFFGRLGRVLIGEGKFSVRVSKDPATGVDRLLTALRLGRMLEGDGPISFYESAAMLQREALQAFDEFVPACSDDVLRAALKELGAMRRGISPQPGVLDFQWRVIDNVMRLKLDPRMDAATGAAADGRKIGVQFVFNTQMKSIRQIIAANRDEFARAAAMSYPDSVAWKSSHADLVRRGGLLGALNPLNLVNRMVVWRAVIETYYGGAEVSIALELYRRGHGARAATLAELGKDYPDLPVDPFTGKPFLYKTQGEDYLLYSAGMNQADDSGAGQDVQTFTMTLWYGSGAFQRGGGTDIAVHRPAPPVAPPAPHLKESAQ